jgi:hypothetical protein
MWGLIASGIGRGIEDNCHMSQDRSGSGLKALLVLLVIVVLLIAVLWISGVLQGGGSMEDLRL